VKDLSDLLLPERAGRVSKCQCGVGDVIGAR
jgi:hypothetical protein